MKAALVKRLERLLVMIPYVARQKNGVPMKKVVEFAGYASARELQEDIELASQISLPPEAPDDFIDIYVEDGRVFIKLPQGFNKPPRLSVGEAAALLAAARPMASSGRVLDSAIRKLRRALPRGAEEELEPLSRASAIEARPSPFREVLADAAETRKEMELDYVSGGAGARTRRMVEPHHVFLHSGRWYLAAWDVNASEEKLFRLDRIVEVRASGRTFAEHKGPDPKRFDTDFLYFDSGGEREVEVRFAPSIAGVVLERWGELATKNADGSVTVVVRSAGDNYILSWVMAFGGAATVVRPDELKQALAKRVEETRKKYA